VIFLFPFLLLEREWVRAAATAMGQHWAGAVLLAVHCGAAVLILLPRCLAAPPTAGGDGQCRPLLAPCFFFTSLFLCLASFYSCGNFRALSMNSYSSFIFSDHASVPFLFEITVPISSIRIFYLLRGRQKLSFKIRVFPHLSTRIF
jgi:hypothetical protein